MQVHVRTNLVPSKSSGNRSGAAGQSHPPSIWSDCGRLFLCHVEIPPVGGWRNTVSVVWENRCTKNRLSTNNTAISTVSDRRYSLPYNKQMNAIAPRSVRMRPRSRSRTISVGLRTEQNWQAPGLAQTKSCPLPLIKVLARLLTRSRVPLVPRVPPFPSFPQRAPAFQ